MEMRRQQKGKNKFNFRFFLEKNNDSLLNERQLHTPPTSPSSKQLIGIKMLRYALGSSSVTISISTLTISAISNVKANSK